MELHHYQRLQQAVSDQQRQLAILLDPEKFDLKDAPAFLRAIPSETTHIFIGGSTATRQDTHALVTTIKSLTARPVFLFPGDYTQISAAADAILFLSLLSGRNPEYLIGQQQKAVSHLQNTQLEVIATGYLLIDGGTESAVSRVTDTTPMPQQETQAIVDTAVAGMYMGAKLIYLEAGSGALNPVRPEVITAVKKQISVPLIVGGGIRSVAQKEAAYQAGADMVVMGTYFEQQNSH